MMVKVKVNVRDLVGQGVLGVHDGLDEENLAQDVEEVAFIVDLVVVLDLDEVTMDVDLAVAKGLEDQVLDYYVVFYLDLN